ncbi:MAG TPA: KTSC domain-containing protein [Kiritimatiellia bacterium]|nr:KTSC domain-containing protein [Kiritimatiellia bacterium]
MKFLKSLIALVAILGITACSQTASPTVSAPAGGPSGIEYVYDASNQDLTVTFPSGSYRYAGVPADVVAQLDDAESKGRAFNRLIKGKYPETKLD